MSLMTPTHRDNQDSFVTLNRRINNMTIATQLGRLTGLMLKQGQRPANVTAGTRPPNNAPLPANVTAGTRPPNNAPLPANVTAGTRPPASGTPMSPANATAGRRPGPPGSGGSGYPGPVQPADMPRDTQRERDTAVRAQLRAAGLDGPRGPQGRPLGGNWGSAPTRPIRGTGPTNY